MSRGYGRIERNALAVLRNADRLVSGRDIAAEAEGLSGVPPTLYSNYMRALRGLARVGTVVDMGRGFPNGCRHYALEEVARRFLAEFQSRHVKPWRVKHKIKRCQPPRLSPEQCRAGRYLVGLSRERLIAASGVSQATLRDFEAGRRRTSAQAQAKIAAALEAAGVVLGPGHEPLLKAQ